MPQPISFFCEHAFKSLPMTFGAAAPGELRSDFHPGFLRCTTAAVPLPPHVGWHRHGALTFVVEEGGGVSIAAYTTRTHTHAQYTCVSHPFRSPALQSTFVSIRIVSSSVLASSMVWSSPHFFTRKCKILGSISSKAVVCSSVSAGDGSFAPCTTRGLYLQ